MRRLNSAMIWILAHVRIASSVMMVKRPLPCTTSAKPPSSWIEKTRIGMRFSRASDDRRGVHHLEIARQHVEIGEALVADRRLGPSFGSAV